MWAGAFSPAPLPLPGDSQCTAENKAKTWYGLRGEDIHVVYQGRGQHKMNCIATWNYRRAFQLLNGSGLRPDHAQMVLRHLEVGDSLKDIETDADYKVACIALDNLNARVTPGDHLSDDAILRNALNA